MEEDLEDLYENAPCGYISIDTNGHIVKSNLTLSKWIGIPRAKLLGKRTKQILTMSSAIFYETHVSPLLRMQGHFEEVALDLVTHDGKPLAVLANAAERRDGNDNLLFTRLTILKATDRRRYERDLVEARNAAEHGLEAEREAAELREQFMAVLGHDLRNPLAGFEGGLRLVSRKLQGNEDRKIADLMLQSVERMKRLINNVLDLARSRQGGGLRLDIQRGMGIEPVLTQVIDELEMAFPGRVIQRQIDVSEPVDFDQGRIEQLVSNLVGNALTHGDAEMPVSVEAVARDNELTIVVTNGGRPIPQATIDRLFQPFYRDEEQSSSKGLGLGLFIAAQIANAHGGTLSVASDENRTSFTLAMPTKTPSAPKAGRDSDEISSRQPRLDPKI